MSLCLIRIKHQTTVSNSDWNNLNRCEENNLHNVVPEKIRESSND